MDADTVGTDDDSVLCSWDSAVFVAISWMGEVEKSLELGEASSFECSCSVLIRFMSRGSSWQRFPIFRLTQRVQGRSVSRKTKPQKGIGCHDVSYATFSKKK